ncbi:MAG: hypothetical protein U9O82_14305 [Thermodesulfobacteriota bacterium]|nr:hypothetical protein [Thermodesulfobacteriota bacterium]
MSYFKSKFTRYGLKFCLSILTCIASILFAALTTTAMPEQKRQPDADALPEDNLTIEDSETPNFLLFDGKDSFVYKREGRTDPFMPFVQAKVKATISPVVEDELTGMRKFEPGQLNLVAITFSGQDPIAMVQDSTQKGYILHQGMKIGRSGVVDKIVPNVVIIKQTFITPTGKKRHKILEMALRKEGEERL